MNKPIANVVKMAVTQEVRKPEVGSLDAALDELNIPDGDLAEKIIDRETSYENDADCEGCKI